MNARSRLQSQQSQVGWSQINWCPLACCRLSERWWKCGMYCGQWTFSQNCCHIQICTLIFFNIVSIRCHINPCCCVRWCVVCTYDSPFVVLTLLVGWVALQTIIRTRRLPCRSVERFATRLLQTVSTKHTPSWNFYFVSWLQISLDEMMVTSWQYI